MPVTELKKTTFEEVLKMFDPKVHDALKANYEKKGTQGIVVFENLQMDSSNFGQRTALIYGPGCSYPTLDALREGRLGDVPSRFQYPTFYAEKEAKKPKAPPVVEGERAWVSTKPETVKKAIADSKDGQLYGVKFVKVEPNEWRFQVAKDAEYKFNHYCMAKGCVPLAAGILSIIGGVVKVYDDYSETLGVGCDDKHFDELETLLGVKLEKRP